MSSIDKTNKTITIKIVYYGAENSGKTVNLAAIHSAIPNEKGSVVTPICLKENKSVFFDFFPLKLGKLNSYETLIELYTTPGAYQYSSAREQILKDTDAIVFVVDSTINAMDNNIRAISELVRELKLFDVEITDIPIHIQYNKQDKKDIIELSELNSQINPYCFPFSLATAIKGQGTFETLKAVCKQVLNRISTQNELI